MPDSVSKQCYECGERFTTFRRRHHCRVCGQIFCSKCCSDQIPGKIMGCTGTKIKVFLINIHISDIYIIYLFIILCDYICNYG